MPNPPLPAGQIVLAFAGLLLLGLGLLVRYLPFDQSETRPLPPSTHLDVGDETLRYFDPIQAAGFREIVQHQSPFVSDRSAFSRTPAQVFQNELKPQFVGVVGRGSTLKAMVRWAEQDPVSTHSVGDKTPWGTLVSATSSQLVFNGEYGSRVLRLF